MRSTTAAFEIVYAAYKSQYLTSGISIYNWNPKAKQWKSKLEFGRDPLINAIRSQFLREKRVEPAHILDTLGLLLRS
ncbi:hypothetical protein CEXT_525341 [Caerostris extrusa]|uniref:Uncharacterized protein n=1 Tax=Caerostris extrusa TaxID=172846 RepID=A0AAV4MMS9_CAEEX|nr:hypothetical protein CEXT_525341 [Caerostris extrusa]